MRTRLILLAAFLCVGAFGPLAAWAANTNSVLALAGLPVTLSVDGEDASVDELDTGTSASKRAAVVQFDVDGRVCVALVRIQKGSNGLFIDIAAAPTVAELTTRVAAMNLSGRSHPSPSGDAIDTAILAAAGAD